MSKNEEDKELEIEAVIKPKESNVRKVHYKSKASLGKSEAIERYTIAELEEDERDTEGEGKEKER